MEISLLKLLLKNISSFSQLSSFTGASLDVNRKYYQKVEELLNLLKPILDAIISSEIASDEMLNKSFEVLGQSVDELGDLFENWLPLSSKFYFVLQAELLISKARNLALEICLMLKSQQHLPDELNSTSAEYCMQKIKHIVSDQTSAMIEEATRYQGEGIEPSPEILSKITESLNLKSNQEILIEAVALEKLKENAEQAEKIEEAMIIDQMIALVMHLHDRLVLIKESKTNSPVPIPADFCCPLSLELMTDPVIVASGQTYERAFIKNWIELGLTVCPKTRQALAHINLIPNYTVKALIANWCEINKVKLPDPTKYASLNQPSKLLGHAEACSPNDHHAFSPSRGSQTLSTEHNLSTSSPGKSLISSSWIHREGTSPLHPRSTSEGSLPFVATNGQVLDEARLSLMSSEERSTDMDERNGDSVPESVASPPGSRVSVVDRSVGKLMQNHNRSASAGAVVNHTSYPHGVLEDSNESSNVGNHGTAYGSDTSGEVKVEPQGSTTMNSPHREPEFFPRFLDPRARNQSIWRRSSDRPVPRIVSSPTTETRADLAGVEAQVRKLVEDLKSGSVETQREATAELRLLAKHNTDNRIVIANCGAIRLLVDLLHSTDTAIQENAVTALLNLSINDNNKAAIGNALAIEPLIHVLETGSAEAKSNSAATLFSLSVIEENKVKIGRSGAIEPLVKLLGNGTPRGKKDAATALFNLSIFHENKARIVQAGAVRHLMELMDPAAGMVDKAVAVLANLATIPEGRTAIGQGGGIPVLVEVVELGSARGKENAAAGLLQLCKNSSRFCNTVLQEGAVPPLVALSQSGTPRAKEKAQQLLNHFKNQRHGNAGRG